MLAGSECANALLRPLILNEPPHQVQGGCAATSRSQSGMLTVALKVHDSNWGEDFPHLQPSSCCVELQKASALLATLLKNGSLNSISYVCQQQRSDPACTGVGVCATCGEGFGRCVCQGMLTVRTQIFRCSQRPLCSKSKDTISRHGKVLKQQFKIWRRREMKQQLGKQRMNACVSNDTAE